MEFHDIIWHNLAKEVKALDSENPALITLSGDLLKILPKNVEQFREIQQFLCEKNLKFTTLSPKNQRPVKIYIKGIPLY